jgi:autotransporter-associated beta strand protein
VSYFNLRNGQIQFDPRGLRVSAYIVTYTSGTANISGTTPGPFTYATGTVTNAYSPATGTAKTFPAVQTVGGLPPTTFPARVGLTIGPPLSPSLTSTGDASNIASTDSHGYWDKAWAFPADMVTSGSVASMVMGNFKTIGQNSNANANILGYGLGFSTFQYSINGATGTQVGPFIPYNSKAQIAWSATDGTWDTSSKSWTGEASSFIDGDTVNFDSTAGGTVAVSGTLRPDALNFSATTGTFTLSGGTGNVVSGTGALTKSGAGTTVITSDNEWSGGTNLSNGTLRAGTNRALGTGTFSLLGGTIASADSSARTFDNAVTVAGNVVVGDGTGTGAVTFSGATNLSGSTRSITTVADTTFSGVISDGGLAKAGTGTLTLTGTNTYTGATTVTAGLLTVNGNNSSSALTTVEAGATLGGSGTVGALVVENGATIAPGNSPGTLTASGNVTWQAGGNYNWQLVDALGTAGTGWDTLAISGTLDLALLSSANPFNLNLWSLSSAGAVDGDAQNFDSGGNFSWTIATASGGITGFDAFDFFIHNGAINGTNGFTNDLSGGTFSLAVVDGDKLNLVYNGLSGVPEPGSNLALLALGAGGLTLRRRLKRAA